MASLFDRPYQHCVLGLILGYDYGGASGSSSTHAFGDFGQDMLLRFVVNVLRRIQAETIEVKLLDPVARVGDKKFAHRPRVRAVEIERFSPVRRVTIREVMF